MKKKCRKCNTKNALVDGLCYGCYKEEHGHAYKPETHRGEKKAAEKPVQEWPDKAKNQVKATVADVFPDLPDDLPVYRRTDFTDHLEALIAEKEKQLDALKTVLSIAREAA